MSNLSDHGASELPATADRVPPLIATASPAQSAAILGAMRAVAETGGPLSAAASRTLAAADRYLFDGSHPAGPAALPPLTPDQLAAALAGSDLAENATRFLTVMALVDGRLDKQRIAAVGRYAQALGIAQRYLEEMAAAAQDRLEEALADMTRCNMESITNRSWTGGDAGRWLVPYQDGNADPALAARFAALGDLPRESLGYAIWEHFRRNGYGFPGEASGLNVAFSLPHDTVHVLTGYDTSPGGEILTSTFTAAMHPTYPMAGHVLPVLLSWHVGTRINDVAGAAKGALDPEEFWRAWAAGAATTVDTFAPDWDFWEFAGEPLGALRERWALPRSGLAPNA
jgi:hypothetical protein